MWFKVASNIPIELYGIKKAIHPMHPKVNKFSIQNPFKYSCESCTSMAMSIRHTNPLVQSPPRPWAPCSSWLPWVPLTNKQILLNEYTVLFEMMGNHINIEEFSLPWQNLLNIPLRCKMYLGHVFAWPRPPAINILVHLTPEKKLIYPIKYIKARTII